MTKIRYKEAYDWRDGVLSKDLRNLSFSDKWISWIMQSITKMTYLMIIIDSPDKKQTKPNQPKAFDWKTLLILCFYIIYAEL